MDTRSEKVYEAIEKQVDASLVHAYMKEANR